jgi:iron(III) transport system ATP-binding protein
MYMPGEDAVGGAGPQLAADAAFISVSGLSKSYGSFRALADVSFSIGAGHGLALLGPSGCGKTTILRCIAGLETPDTGRIDIGGVTVFDAARKIDLPPERRELGIVFQSYAIWPHMSVGENVGLPLKVRRVPAKEIAQRVDDTLALVGLKGWHERSAMALSGGQQQRVALARAIVHHPRLVLFDEPMSNLDTQLREEMRVDLRLMQERIGFTSVYVTHDHGEAFSLARDVLVMNRGQVEMKGEPHDVYFNPSTPFVAKFFGYNVLDAIAITPREVELAPGLRLAVAPHDLAPGAPVTLCIRKEDIALQESEGSSCMVEAQVFQGGHDELIVACGDVRLRVIQPPRRMPHRAMRFSIPPERCIVLARPTP